MSDKLQKTDSAIVPASKIADKIASALKDDKPANTGARCDAHYYRRQMTARCDFVRLHEGEHVNAAVNIRWSKRCESVHTGDTCSLQLDHAGPHENVFADQAWMIGDKELRQQAKVERFGTNAMVQGLAADKIKITKDLREWAMQSERVAERKNFVGTDFEALELRTLAASLVPTVTLPTESSAKSFDVKVVGADGNPVELLPEVEMPDLRVGCGAEFSVPVNGKTLRCTKWRGHSGDHSDKINGVPINWANK